jgi:antitoxin component YwqK of YwqJK toxin-antitoxin module
MTEPINQTDSQGRPHGVWDEYWGDGLKRRGTWLHGVLHGAWKTYNEAGIVTWRRHYLHGKLHRLSENYRSDGTLYFKRYYLTIK